MSDSLFVFPGNACILKDFENDVYVGVAYAMMMNKVPIFATFATPANQKQTREFSLLWIVESIEQGLREKGKECSHPIAYREQNKAIITGEQKHYAVGVSAGSLYYALPTDSIVTDEQLSAALSAKMRCTNRN